MHATELIIGDHAYRLPVGTDEAEVITQLTEAVRAGGGVVELPMVSADLEHSVLVSPGVAVFIERMHIPEPTEDPTDDGGGPLTLDELI